MNDIKEEIQKAGEVINRGGLILYPTDTIWGIGCDATNNQAVERVYDLKQRVDHKAMLVLLDSPDKLLQYVSEVPERAWDLIELTDKPLTIIYPEGINLATRLLGDDRSIGIRITRELFSKQLCACMRKPLVSTSANISGQPAPASFRDISDEIKNGVDYVVRYRQNERTNSKPSGIIRLNINNTFQIIRK